MSQVELAYGHIQAGRLSEAIRILEPICTHEPHHHVAAHLLGLAYVMQGTIEPGLELLQRSVELMPENPQYVENYVSSLLQNGHPQKAISACNATLSLVPQALSVLRLKAIALTQLSDLWAARECYNELIARISNSSEVFNERGVIHARLGLLEAARADFERSVLINAKFDQGHYNLGNLFMEAGRHHEALQATDRALRINPNYVQAWNNRGLILFAMHQLEGAIECFKRAISLDEGFIDAHNNYGVILREMKQLEEAVSAFDYALKLNPSHVDALINKAYALYEMGHVEKAIACCEHVIAIDDDHPQAQIASVIFRLPVVPRSVDESTQAVTQFTQSIQRLMQLVSAKRPAFANAIGRTQPFYLAYRPEDVTSALCAYGDLAAEAMVGRVEAQLTSSPPRDPPIRLMIFSGHFYRHAVWEIILKGLISQIDKAKFDLVLCHSSPKCDEETRLAQQACREFFQGPKTALEWAALVQEIKPDVIFYPEVGMDPIIGHLAAMRLAPLQVASWGHPVTTGLPTIDMFFSGQALEPTNAVGHYRETLMKLPRNGVYLYPTEQDADLFETPRLSPQTVRFAVPHQPFKFDPSDDELYLNIAREMHSCEFWFVRPPHLSWALDALLMRLGKVFAAAGLNPDCLRVTPWMSPAEFAGFLDAMDVYLDCPSFSGFTTAWSALQRGLPVITLEGAFMRQRLASALLREMGRPEGVVCFREDYIQKAVEWGARSRDRVAWGQYRSVLRNASLSVACDLYAVRGFEDAIMGALKRP